MTPAYHTHTTGPYQKDREQKRSEGFKAAVFHWEKLLFTLYKRLVYGVINAVSLNSRLI